MSEDARVQRIDDREAIRDLLARYCYRIAAADVDGVIALFTSGCRVEILGQEYVGETGLRELYASSLAVRPKPYIHNHLIEELGELSAAGRCVLEIRQTRDGVSETGGGCYEDRYRKEGGVWKFEERTFRVY